jgi:sodium transport system permease protein
MLSNWKSGWIIARKEIIDNFRDRRTLTTIGFSVIVGPLLMFGFLWFAEKTVKEETDLVNAQAIELAVEGAQYAPNLIAWLRQNNFQIEPATDNSERALRDGEHRVILKITSDFASALEAGKTAPILLIHDSSISGLEKIGFQNLRKAIIQYSAQISALRLQARGVNPQIMRTIQVNISDVASAESRNAQILTMLPYVIIIFIMAGGMYLAIDTTAGERENGSLEPLLTQPVDRSTVVLAKLSATIVFSALTLLLVLIGLAVSFNTLPIDAISISMNVSKIVTIFFSCLPFVFVGCALMVLIASFTKSYKEAQSYMGMVMFVPSMPLILLAFLSPEPSLTNMWVPSLSQGLIIIETLKGESIEPSLIALSMLASTMCAGILAVIAIQIYKRERVFG